MLRIVNWPKLKQSLTVRFRLHMRTPHEQSLTVRPLLHTGRSSAERRRVPQLGSYYQFRRGALVPVTWTAYNPAGALISRSHPC